MFGKTASTLMHKKWYGWHKICERFLTKFCSGNMPPIDIIIKNCPLLLTALLSATCSGWESDVICSCKYQAAFDRNSYDLKYFCSSAFSCLECKHNGFWVRKFIDVNIFNSRIQPPKVSLRMISRLSNFDLI